MATDKLGNTLEVGDTVAWATTRYRSAVLRHGVVEEVGDATVQVVYDTERRKGLYKTECSSEVTLCQIP